MLLSDPPMHAPLLFVHFSKMPDFILFFLLITAPSQLNPVCSISTLLRSVPKIAVIRGRCGRWSDGVSCGEGGVYPCIPEVKFGSGICVGYW